MPGCPPRLLLSLFLASHWVVVRQHLCSNDHFACLWNQLEGNETLKIYLNFKETNIVEIESNRLIIEIIEIWLVKKRTINYFNYQVGRERHVGGWLSLKQSASTFFVFAKEDGSISSKFADTNVVMPSQVLVVLLCTISQRTRKQCYLRLQSFHFVSVLQGLYWTLMYVCFCLVL